VFDPTATQTVSAENDISIADYSIYEDRKLTGAVETPLVRGEVVAHESEIVADHGQGEYATRGIPTRTSETVVPLIPNRSHSGLDERSHRLTGLRWNR